MDPHEEAVFDYDVFVSYSASSAADRGWVRGVLVPRLQAHGLRVCVDFQDFRPGSQHFREIERALGSSRKTVVVLSPDYLADTWGEAESLMLQTLAPTNEDARLIPLRKAICDLPLRLSMLTYVDFAAPDDPEFAWAQLLTALGAAPQPPSPSLPQPDQWWLRHPYPMQPNFMGRAAERSALSRWLDDDREHPLVVVRALGGFGKSALTWHWLLHDVDPQRWPHVVWWSFYEQEADFDSLLRAILSYLKAPAAEIDAPPRQQAEALLGRLRQPGTLIILDGAERMLRVYSGLDTVYQGDDPDAITSERDQEQQRACSSPVAEDFLRRLATLPDMQSKVLLTSRLRPRAAEQHGDLLSGCLEVEVAQLDPSDAVAFFRAQGVRGSRAAIERACALYGYHPLSLRLLAGRIVKDVRLPGDIAAARRQDVSGDLRQRQHHVLAQAYDQLSPTQRQILQRIATFRMPVGLEGLTMLAPDDDIERPLQDLIERGLVQHDQHQHQFDLHPLVRRYTYDRMSADERGALHRQLRDYFAALPLPAQPQRLADLAPVIELYHHTVQAGEYDAAVALFYARIEHPTYFRFGAYQLRIDLLQALFPSGEDAPPALSKPSDQAWTLAALANSYSLSGQPTHAVGLFRRHNAIFEAADDRRNLAAGLGNLAIQQINIGELRAASASIQVQIALGHALGDQVTVAVGQRNVGRLLAYQGYWDDAALALQLAQPVFEAQQEAQAQCTLWFCSGLRLSLLVRTPAATDAQRAEFVEVARRVLALADLQAAAGSPVERDYVRAYWLLGAALRATGDAALAQQHLDTALTRCRMINLIELEVPIVQELARLALAADQPELAREQMEEALAITEQCGYRLQGADVQLLLADIALHTGDHALAQRHAAAARDLALCDGAPDFVYQAAYSAALARLAAVETVGV